MVGMWTFSALLPTLNPQWSIGNRQLTDGLCDDDRVYYLQDANFNVTALVDENGDAEERYVYEPYGEVTIYNYNYSSTITWAASKKNEIQYCGYRYNPETGLSHVRNRSYHPTLGRWVQRDPLGYADGMSLYEYVRSRPIIAVDPMGQRFTEEAIWGAGNRKITIWWRIFRCDLCTDPQKEMIKDALWHAANRIANASKFMKWFQDAGKEKWTKPGKYRIERWFQINWADHKQETRLRERLKWFDSGIHNIHIEIACDNQKGYHWCAAGRAGFVLDFPKRIVFCPPALEPGKWAFRIRHTIHELSHLRLRTTDALAGHKTVYFHPERKEYVEPEITVRIFRKEIKVTSSLGRYPVRKGVNTKTDPFWSYVNHADTLAWFISEFVTP